MAHHTRLYDAWYIRIVPTQLVTGELWSLDSLLSDGVRSLDITEAERDQAVARYEALGAVLDDHWEDTRGHNVITPQGSFLLGTVVRNIYSDDDIDLDAVAIRDVDRSTLSQTELKRDAGVAVHRYADSWGSGGPSVSECHRCWTLTWRGMHLDLLPAVPNREPWQSGIWITDKDVRQWLPSDPTGYSTWFENQMHRAFLEERVKLSKKLQVDDVPGWQVKTTLQQTVQALKRHRDIYFNGRLDERPASIILTTLAARAYEGGDALYDVLRTVTSRMGSLVENRGGTWWVSNPVRGDENFADAWAAHPQRAEWFFEWLEAAVTDFNGFGDKAGLDSTVPRLDAAFGTRFAKAASFGYGKNLYDARTSRQLHVATGGALVSAPVPTTTRRVRSHGFEGGPRR